MGKCKTKAIQANLGTFRHNQTYPKIIQAYLEACLTLTYLKLWYIQNPNVLRTRTIFRTLLYSEHWHIQNLRHIQNPIAHLRGSVNYFHG